MKVASRPAPEDDLRAERTERSHGRIALALLVVVWLAFSFPAFTGKARFPLDFSGSSSREPGRSLANSELGDVFYAVYPWHSYLGERLRSGHLPTWDPYRFGGVPFAANIGTGTFYPPNWVYGTGHALLALTLVAVTSLLAALLLAYWFLRRLRLHPFAALVGAVVFTFSAFMMKWSTAEPVFGSAMWLPLALGGLEVARQGRTRRGVVLAAAGLALSVLAGHAQIALMVWLATGLWALGGLVATARHGPRSPGAVARRVRPEATATLGAFLLAAGIAAVQVLPTLQFAGLIVRQQTGLQHALLSRLPVQRLPTIVVPDYFGSPVDHNVAGPGVNYQETALYAGVLTLPLALVGLRRRPRRVPAFFAALALLGLLAALGTPLYRLIIRLPGFSHTLFVTRFIFFFDVGLAGLAALGLHSLITEPTRGTAKLAAGATAVTAGVVVVLGVAQPGTPLPISYVAAKSATSLAIAVAGGALLVAMGRRRSGRVPLAAGLCVLVAFDLWVFGFRFNPYFTPGEVYIRRPEVAALASVPGPRPRYADVSRGQIAPNGALVYHLYGLEGYDPFVPRGMLELITLADDQRMRALDNRVGPFDAPAFRSPIMDLLGVRTAIGPGDAPLDGPRRIVGGAALFDRPTAFPPAFLTSCWELRPGATVLGRLGTMSSAELRATAVVDDDAAARRALPGAPAGGCGSGGDVTIARYEPERVVARARAGAASVLVLGDAWYPGWEARVDGKRVPLLRVDHALRGVALPAGSHRVEFDFRPPLVRRGAALTAATLLFMVAWSGAPWWRGDRRLSAERSTR